MLSIAALGHGAGQGNYYLDLAKEDYYLAGGEPLGIWFGEGAALLHLEGHVQRDQFHHLLRGFSQDGGTPLVRNAGDKDRQSGWDLTFSVPKSVAVAWAVAPPEIRAQIENAHRQAVREALSYVQEVAGLTRRGRGGVAVEPAKLVAALFEHGTSRAQDPEPHTHAIVLNVGCRADGTTGTIRSIEIFQHKMAAGAIYRSALAEGLQRSPGFEIELDRKAFKIKGVPESVCSEFSKRRAEIEEAMAKRGLRGAVAAKVAALDTREAKESVPRAVLFERWKETGKKHGWTESALISLVGRARLKPDLDVLAQQLATDAIRDLTTSKSCFTERDLTRRVAELAPSHGIGASGVLRAAKQRLAQSDVESLGRINQGEKLYTTAEVLAEEKALLDRVKRLHARSQHRIETDRVFSTLGKHSHLSEEQRKAVQYITATPGAIKVVSGMAGTGKSTMLKVARETWEKSGFTVIGAALSGKAAQGLEESAGIQSATLARTLHDLGLPLFGLEVRYRRLAPRAPRWSPLRDVKIPHLAFKRDAISLTKRTILVVDEAGMVGTQTMKALVDAVASAGAKLVLVGDARQLQPIEAGGPFKAISKLVGATELKDIQRQKEPWARDMVSLFAAGEAKKALAMAAERGLVHKTRTAVDAKEKLIEDWKMDGLRRPEKNLILASRNEDVSELNLAAQTQRKRAGWLGRPTIDIEGTTFHVGDRVLFTRNCKLLGVKNGHLGTLARIDDSVIHVDVDGGKRVSIPTRSYKHITLGYAVTTHKAQGMTANNTYILIDPTMQNRELSYVQASRARNLTRFYLDQITAGQYMREVAKLMGQSQQKEMATAIMEATRRHQEEEEQIRQAQRHTR